jgi:hypothetical protein
VQVITEFHGDVTRHGQPNIQESEKKFKTKQHEKTQKQINELTGVLNKHQSETENTINR